MTTFVTTGDVGGDVMGCPLSGSIKRPDLPRLGRVRSLRSHRFYQHVGEVILADVGNAWKLDRRLPENHIRRRTAPSCQR